MAQVPRCHRRGGHGQCTLSFPLNMSQKPHLHLGQNVIQFDGVLCFRLSLNLLSLLTICPKSLSVSGSVRTGAGHSNVLKIWVLSSCQDCELQREPPGGPEERCTGQHREQPIFTLPVVHTSWHTSGQCPLLEWMGD